MGQVCFTAISSNSACHHGLHCFQFQCSRSFSVFVGKNEFTVGKILSGHFWCTIFWVPDPPPSSLLIRAGRLRAGQDPGASPPLREQGQQGAAGQDLGQQGAARRAVRQAQGQPEAAAPGQGCQGQGQGQGQGGPPFPPARRCPPLPPWAGRVGTGAQQCDKGGQGSTWGRPSVAPLAAQGHGSPSAGPPEGGF